MLISKSLFVEYWDFPKMAWWKVNNPKVYQQIKWLKKKESEQMLELWQEVEDLVWDYFSFKYWNSRINILDNAHKISTPESSWTHFERNSNLTKQAIIDKVPIIYKPAFYIDWLFVQSDFLILDNWSYSLVEVKSKTRIRKARYHNKVKYKNYGNVESRLLHDISFQRYVVDKFMQHNQFAQINDVFVAYLNPLYKKQWNIDLSSIVILDKIWVERIVIFQWESDERIDLIENQLLNTWIIESKLNLMRIELNLSEDDFNLIHPFAGVRYDEYFWKEREFWSIYSRWINCPFAVRTLHFQWKTILDELSTEDLNLFITPDWEAINYINKYRQAKLEWRDIIQVEEIGKEFEGIKYPVCFYDYESISIPVPFFEDTAPYQSVVVQYSLHKLFIDWKIEHYWWILTSTWCHSINKATTSKHKNQIGFESEKLITWSYQDLLNEFIKDIGDDLGNCTFVVWHKPFENQRNIEIAETFEQLSDKFLQINENTYDLMDIFKKWLYYSLNFKGSISIKSILPALIQDMKYEWLWVCDWLQAMKLLDQLIRWRINQQESTKIIEDLLIYCGQDSLALYLIFDKLRQIIWNDSQKKSMPPL